MLVIPTHINLARLVALLAILVGLLLPSGQTASAQAEQPAGKWGPPNLSVVQTGPPVSENGLYLTYTVPYTDVDAEMSLTRTPPFAEPWDPWEETAAPGDYVDTEVKSGQKYTYVLCIVYKQDDTESPKFCSNPASFTYEAAPAQGTPTNPPIISGATPYQTDVDVRWYTEPKNDYDKEIVRYRVKPSAGNQNPPWLEINHDGGDEGSTRVSGLTPHTTYLFSVAGCWDVLFGLDGQDCTDWGKEFEVTTLAVETGHGDAIVIKRHDQGETSIDLYWDKPVGFGFASYKISYHEKAGGPTMTGTGPGDFPNFTASNLKPNTSYLFKVQGCNVDIANAGMACDDFGPEYEASTKTNAPLPGSFVTAAISLSQPTITAGNTVDVKGTGWQEAIGTTVQLTLSSGTALGTAKVDTGAISATVTIPAGTQPGDYKIVAKSPSHNAEASIKVIAPSKTGTLTITLVDNGEASPDLMANSGPYALNGANFAPGALTIYIDSPSGHQLGTATVAANGTFRKEFDIQKEDIASKYGAHKLVVVQNGTTTGEIAITVAPEYIIH
jgi:hypothetical protein